MSGVTDDKQVQSLVDKVWRESAPSLKFEIEKVIKSELSIRSQGMTRKVLHEQLTPLVKQIIDERRETIAAAVEEQVRKHLDEQMEKVLKENVGYLLKEAAADVLEKVMRRMRAEAYK